MFQLKHYVLGFVLSTANLLSSSALSTSLDIENDQPGLPAQNHIEIAQQGNCWERYGPYATQSTAWQRWRQAQSQGYSVSNGVVPCYDGYGSRGYCFNIYYQC